MTDTQKGAKFQIAQLLSEPDMVFHEIVLCYQLYIYKKNPKLKKPKIISTFM